MDLEPDAAYAHSVLMALASALEIKVDAGHSDVLKYLDRLVPRIYNLFIYLAVSSDGRGAITTDPRLLNVAAQIITLITQVAPVE